MPTDDADLTWGGRLFQKQGPATENARSPYVDSLVRRTIKLIDITLNEVYDVSQNQTNDWVHQLDQLDQSHVGTNKQT